jgi:ABC transporter substrate binding protein
MEVPMRSSTVGFLVLCTPGLFAMPLVAASQPSRKVPRLGMLLVSRAAEPSPSLEAFRQGLRELSWVEGQNISLEYRYAEGRYERLPDLAAALVRLPVDVLFVQSAPGAQAAKQATTPFPIVMETLADPVAFGLVEGVARPSGNLTGVSGFAPELSGKRLELLKEVVPGLTRVAVLINPANPNGERGARGATVAGARRSAATARGGTGRWRGWHRTVTYECRKASGRGNSPEGG